MSYLSLRDTLITGIRNTIIIAGASLVIYCLDSLVAVLAL